MRDMLYIDGQLVDLGEDVNIVLNYRSNLLTDLGKIVGNNSYTIRLPKTMRNLGIIGVSDIPSVVSSFPRETHEARYFRNGIEIVPDGRAVLMGVSDSIEVVLTWGSSSAFVKMVNDGKSLNEFENVADFVPWTALNMKSVYDGVSKIMNADIDFGLEAGEKLAVIHPSVRVSYVLGLLESRYGISFEWPEERDGFIGSLIMPLLTRNDGYANWSRMTGRVIWNVLTEDVSVVKGDDFDRVFERYLKPYDDDMVAFRVLRDCRVMVYPSFRSLRADAGVYYGSEQVEDNFVPFPYRMADGGSLVNPLYQYEGSVELDLMEGDLFGVSLTFAVKDSNLDSFFSFEMRVSRVEIGDRFPVVENLPAVKAVDFVKALAAVAGVFVVPSGGMDVVRLVPFDVLMDRASAVDWSDRVVSDDVAGRPLSVGYSLDGFAKQNRMLWKDDASVVSLDVNGSYYVDDVTAEYVRDAVVLPFAATEVRNGRASIRLYDYPNPVGIYDKGEPELQDVEPRLLVEKNVGGYSTGTFEGLHWVTLLGKYYGAYQNAVKSPVVITEKILLDELSQRDLDVSKSVYLRQRGKYYAIVEVKAPSSGVCECKLLQLD